MSNREPLYAELLDVLEAIDFDRSYYGFYESIRDRSQKRWEGARREDFEAVLSRTGLEFSYDKKERFFAYREKRDSMTLGLNVAFRYGEAEFILVARIDGEEIGGPFPMLAYHIGRRRDPSFQPSPSRPRLPFSDRENLEDVVRFGVELYGRARDAMLARDWSAAG
jgi:hypothetical protein